MHGVIAQLKQLGKARTSETYTITLNSFMAFREEQDVPLDGVSSDMMLMYEAFLKARGVRMNTISFYMRNLRAVYNRAVEKRLTPLKLSRKQKKSLGSTKGRSICSILWITTVITWSSSAT